MATKKTIELANKFIDLTVDEVSLVDRPANERKFLVLKRDTMPKTKSETEDVVKASEEEVDQTPETEQEVDDATPEEVAAVETVEEVAVVETTSEEVAEVAPVEAPVEVKKNMAGASMNAAAKMSRDIFKAAAESLADGEEKQACMLVLEYLESTEFYTRIDAYTVVKNAEAKNKKISDAIEFLEGLRAGEEVVEVEKAVENTSAGTKVVDAMEIAKMAAKLAVEPIAARLVETEKKLSEFVEAQQVVNKAVPSPRSQQGDSVPTKKAVVSEVDELFGNIFGE